MDATGRRSCDTRNKVLSMKGPWYFLLLIGVLALVAGCTTPVENTTAETTTAPPMEMPVTTPVTTLPALTTDLPDFEYAKVPVISSGDTDWMTTNASYVARIALRDEAARAMYLEGGKVEGVLLSCHPTPFPSSGDECAPALRITNQTVTVDFLVDEEGERVIAVVVEVKENV